MRPLVEDAQKAPPLSDIIAASIPAQYQSYTGKMGGCAMDKQAKGAKNKPFFGPPSNGDELPVSYP